MYPSKSNRIQIVLTKHALKSINERSGSLKLIRGFLEKRIISLHKRSDGFEILTPWGRLIGIFEDETFFVKTFVYLWRNKRDYNEHGKRSPKIHDFFCIRVQIPIIRYRTLRKKSDKKSSQHRTLKVNRLGC